MLIPTFRPDVLKNLINSVCQIVGLVTLVLHGQRAAGNGGDPGAGDFDETQRAHQLDKIINLAGLACQLEDEALGGGIDQLGMEGLGQTLRFAALIALAAHFDHRQFTLNRPPREGEVSHFVNGDDALQLMADLLNGLRRARCYYGDAREMFAMRNFGNCEAFNIIATAREETDDTCQNARLIINDHS